jgi:membrane protease YdiL (CAAX protease family)
MKKYKSNWIFFLSITTLLLFFFSILFFVDIEKMNNSRMNYNVSFYIFSFYAVLIAPLLEETTFRGVFTNNKFLKKTSIILTIFIGLVLFYSNYTIWITLILLLIILLNFYLHSSKKLTNYKNKFLVITNATLFGFIHYKISDFESINSSVLVLSQISIGFLLIWITKNFGLIKSIFTHSAFNFIIVFITFYSIQFVDTKLNRKESKNVIIQWNQNPFLESRMGNFQNKENEVVIKNLDIYNSISLSNISTQKEVFFIKYPFAKYNITITSKNKKISEKEIIEAFEMAKLVSFE